MTTYQPTSLNKIADRIYQTKFSGLYYLDHKIASDSRGFFAELALVSDLEVVLQHSFHIQQLNLAHSVDNVIRGFHAEAWDKLITLVRGTIFSALVDLRPASSTFGQVETFFLGDRTDALKGCLYIPEGIANSVCVVEGPVDYLYCVNNLYRQRDKTKDQAISLFDPDIHVTWPILKKDMIYSQRDTKAITLREKFPSKFTH